MYRKSYHTNHGIGVGSNIGISVSKRLKFLHERFLFDRQGADRGAILYVGRFCSSFNVHNGCLMRESRIFCVN